MAGAFPRPLRLVVDLWQRSLQARVVLSTLLLSAVVVALLGWGLLRQVSSDLLEGKERNSLAEATAGFRTAQSQLDAADAREGINASQLLTELVITGRNGDDSRYDVVLTAPVGEAGQQTLTRLVLKSVGVRISSIPAALRRAVASQTGVFYQYTRISYELGVDQPPVPGLVVGAQVRLPAGGDVYTLYYLFPLTEQERTLNVVSRASVTVGLLLVGLLGAIAWLVTRQVVTPVRLARRIAERLAAGRLEERMQIRGRDDLARLGTSFNQMAAGLQRQIRQLEELSRVQRRFVSDVSHELRTPLTTVRMAADVLHEAREQFTGPTRRSAELLQAELDRFESLLTDLLEISRFDAGAAVLEVEETDLRDVVARVVEGAELVAANKGCRLVVRAPTHPCPAEADPRRIERIVRNLVLNAIEHGSGRDVVIRVGGDRAAAAVTVRDHGPGLGPGQSALVFNRFWRADPARSRVTGGTGLGLAIALEDARLHRGWLQAWGEPGNGAQFRLTLPRRAGAALQRSPLPLTPDDQEVPGPVGMPYRRTASAERT